jgi:hypothetical protein
MKSIFTFDSMLTPKLVTILYWLLIAASIITGLTTIFAGYYGVTAESVIMGLLTIVGGMLAARIWCELMIVIFKINDNLQALREKHDA